MATRYPPREDDAKLLDMVRLRLSGQSTRGIAAQFGVSQQRVSAHTSEVKAADLALGWDSPADIRAGYWK